jgi:hypothetical protein
MDRVREVRVWSDGVRAASPTEAKLRKARQFIESFEPQLLWWGRIVDEQVPAQELAGIHKKTKLRIGPGSAVRWSLKSTRETPKTTARRLGIVTE